MSLFLYFWTFLNFNTCIRLVAVLAQATVINKEHIAQVGNVVTGWLIRVTLVFFSPQIQRRTKSGLSEDYSVKNTINKNIFALAKRLKTSGKINRDK